MSNFLYVLIKEIKASEWFLYDYILNVKNNILEKDKFDSSPVDLCIF